MSTLTNKDILVRLKAAIAQDTFNRSGTSGSTTIMSTNGWGTAASDGRTWAGTGSGMTFSLQTNGSTQVGQMTGSTVINIKLLGSISQANVGATVQVAFSSTSDEGGLILRYPSSGNQYRFRYKSGGEFTIAKNVSSTVTNLVTTSFTITTGTLYTIRAQVIGTALYGKIWASSGAEPSSWTLTTTDTAQTTGQFGVYCVLNTSGDTAQFAHFAAYDVPTLNRDAPSRTILASLSPRDSIARIIVAVRRLRDIGQRLKLSARFPRDVPSLFKLVTPGIIRDIALRFILNKIRSSDITGRLQEAIAQDTFNRSSTVGSTSVGDTVGWDVPSDNAITGDTWSGTGAGGVYQIATNGGAQVGQISGTTNIIIRLLGSGTLLNVGAITQFAVFSTTDEAGLLLRSVSGGNHYRFRYNNGKFAIARNVNNVVLSLASTNFALTAGSLYYMRAIAQTSSLALKVWAVGTIEPTAWTLTATDSTLSGGQFGVYCNLSTPAGLVYSTTVLVDSPQAYYRLDETSGVIAHDSSGNSYDAAVSGATLSQVGAIVGDIDTSMAFTAVGGLTFPYTLTPEIWSAASLEFWVNLDGGTGWHYVVNTIDSGGSALYVDGSPTASGSDGTVVIGQSLDFAGSFTTSGKLDEVALYQYVLTPAQVQTHYQAGMKTRAQFANFAVYNAPSTSRHLPVRLVLRALALRDIINARVIIGAILSRNLSTRLYLIPPLIPTPVVRDVGSRLNLTPAPGNVQLGASPIQNNTFMLGLDLPMIRPTTPYQVNGIVLTDLPTMATAPMATSNTIPAGSTFTLLFVNASTATRTALANGSSVSLTFALASGQMVTTSVLVASSLTSSLFQVQATLTQNLVINTRVVSTQFL